MPDLGSHSPLTISGILSLLCSIAVVVVIDICWGGLEARIVSIICWLKHDAFPYTMAEKDSFSCYANFYEYLLLKSPSFILALWSDIKPFCFLAGQPLQECASEISAMLSWFALRPKNWVCRTREDGILQSMQVWSGLWGLTESSHYKTVNFYSNLLTE